MEPLKAGSIHPARIEGYTARGLGVARIGAMVVFVPNALEGERGTVRITRVMRSAAAGVWERLEAPSPYRRSPDCPHFGRCGGCAFRHMAYEEELRAKEARVREALERLGDAAVPLEPIRGAEDPLFYRNKSQYPVGAHGAIGFFQAGSHRVVPVDCCRIQSPAAEETARAVRRWMQRYGAAPYDEGTGRGLLRHVCVRVNRRGESLCCLAVNGKTLPKEPELVGCITAAVPGTVGVLLNVNTRRSNVILGERYRTLYGQNYLMDTLCGLEFKLSMPSFYQVHPAQTEVLYEKALEYAALTGRETALDLYCGIGTITLCLAQRAGRALGAEIVPAAIRDARENARRSGIENAAFFCGDAADIAEQLKKEGLRPDVVTVDPPRKGLSPAVIAAIAAMGPERVVYVSCDPATLGRDVKIFRGAGYAAVRACPVDMFPGTAHVETVCLLEPGQSLTSCQFLP